MELSTKEKILESAIHLFAAQGYTETTMRELAAVVGIKEASLYNHFPSKNAILEYILAEYTLIIHTYFMREKLPELEKNPTAAGIMACMRNSFPRGREEYFSKILCVIMQEQYRNPLIRRLMCEDFILEHEEITRTIIHTLKELKILRLDTDPDFWARMISSLVYAFASRMLLGIGDNSPGFSGMGFHELMRSMYEMLLATCGVESGQVSQAGFPPCPENTISTCIKQ